VWCDKPLPESAQKGHRRREFCNNACKQQHYLWYKQMKRDADALTEPFWRVAYQQLVERYKWLEDMVQARLKEMQELEERTQYYKRYAEDVQADYVARLRALGMSEDQVQEFDAYWKRLQEPPWLREVEP
jgi:uncharacterized protein YfbU (UPF0304 family)